MQLVIGRGYIPFVIIRPENEASLSLYDKLGFRRAYRTVRAVLRPTGWPKDDTIAASLMDPVPVVVPVAIPDAPAEIAEVPIEFVDVPPAFADDGEQVPAIPAPEEFQEDAVSSVLSFCSLFFCSFCCCCRCTATVHGHGQT